MLKENYLKMRKEHRELANQIRPLKETYKNLQRSKAEQIEIVRALRSLELKRSRFRYLHVAYCLARGRTRDEIEPKVKKENRLNERDLLMLMKSWGIDRNDPTSREENPAA